MSAKYKVVYKHTDGTTTREEEVLVEAAAEPTREEARKIAKRDAVRFHDAGTASIEIIAVVPYP
ncbi:hypothetical protein F9C28_17445 [Shimwellia pseudoproteus]|uniref:hypothetical protein n=1 Tax=Shimwellia pseudoproteus TaxID=570012 RepID=UPI0018EDB2D2|nr:hypothetical protein [Shimwellia pseudoproteus]MBJ3816648.1 hypothetical protein [Shimwellia pseudoproteus]